MPLTMWFQPSNSGQPTGKTAVSSSEPYDVVPTWHKTKPTLVVYPTNTVIASGGLAPTGYVVIAPQAAKDSNTINFNTTVNVVATMKLFDITTHALLNTQTYYFSNPVISVSSKTVSSVTFAENLGIGGPTVGTLFYFAMSTTNSTGVPLANTTIKVSSATGLVVGMFVYTTGLPNKYTDGTVITDITGTNVTTSAGPTVTISSGTTFFFVLP